MNNKDYFMLDVCHQLLKSTNREMVIGVPEWSADAKEIWLIANKTKTRNIKKEISKKNN
jgi:hypothetical protein